MGEENSPAGIQTHDLSITSLALISTELSHSPIIMHNLELAHKQNQNDGVTWLELYTWSESEQMQIVKRKSNQALFFFSGHSWI